MSQGAPLGNQNAVKNRPWADAIRRALARASEGDSRSINSLADKLVEKCAEGDMAALKELGDRLDGKPAQAISGDPDGPPLTFQGTVEFVSKQASAG